MSSQTRQSPAHLREPPCQQGGHTTRTCTHTYGNICCAYTLVWEYMPYYVHSIGSCDTQYRDRCLTHSTGTGIKCTHAVQGQVSHTHSTVQEQVSHAHTHLVIGTKNVKQDEGCFYTELSETDSWLQYYLSQDMKKAWSMAHQYFGEQHSHWREQQVWRPEKRAARGAGSEAHEVTAQSCPVTDTSSSFHSIRQLRCLRDCSHALWAQWHNCIQLYESVSHWRT